MRNDIKIATYKIIHTTTYRYGDTVPVCHNEVHLTPRDTASQSCYNSRLHIKPHPDVVSRRHDYFGNQVHSFSIPEGHRRLSVSSTSRVDVREREVTASAKSPAWEIIRDGVHQTQNQDRLEALQFLFNSPSVLASPDLRDYAEPSFPAGKPILEAIGELTTRIHKDFKYDPRATTVNTPLEEVLELRRGVCQDFAHLQIGCLRSIGLPARYVSGYLRTIPPPGKPRLIGADASHAWLSVFCNEIGWVDVDPTNDCFINLDHITVAWGRDYTDVCPIKGVFVGGGTHTMSVSVDVEPIALPAPTENGFESVASTM
ncbi:MAG TPA: transglutaminase family protein [Schlesneria sp.]|jgi:transglutaminase-like putative cysteine protease